MPPPFPILNRLWFHQQGVADPDRAAAEWKAWLDRPRRNRTRNTMVRTAMRLATGFSRASIDYYFHDLTQHQLSRETLERLDALCEALGESLPVARSTTKAHPNRAGGSERLAIFLDLHRPPSPRFHLECLDSVLSATARYNYPVSLHQLSTGGERQLAEVARTIRIARPSGVIWFRLTPDAVILRHLSSQPRPVPSVVVYAARLDYVGALAHVVPGQSNVHDAVAQWARSLPRRGRARCVVLAHMPREPEDYDLPAIPGTRPSVRNERIDLITSAINDAGLQCEPVEVSDYGAANAANAVRKQPDACGWVCLSDEISVGVLQLLEYRGDTQARRRILGFDDSPLAQQYRISSFTQHLPDIGEHVVEVFAAHFRGESQQFGEREIPVELIIR